MAGAVLQKPQGLEEGQTEHHIISGVVGDSWNQSHVAGSCLLVLALGLLGSRSLFAHQWDLGPFCHLIFFLLFLESWSVIIFFF